MYRILRSNRPGSGWITGKLRLSKPQLFQSKILCLSLLYLFTTLFLAVFSSFSPKFKCLFRSSPYDPILSPLFSYNSSYGEHKHALSTSRSSCKSPVFFSDYWGVVKEIKAISEDYSSSLGSWNLRYLQENNADSFGGNFTARRRFSYFHHRDHRKAIPCGFFKHFPIRDSDRIAMEKCTGVVVVSAAFNDHDKIRQPKGLGSETPKMVCFFMFVDDVTMNSLHYHNLVSRKEATERRVGVWRLVEVRKESLYQNAAMNGVIPKFLVHRLFSNSKFSVWIDAKVQLVVDPLLLVHSLVIKENVDMAISRHPFFVHTMEEAMATARWNKWGDVYGLKMQMETYCGNGLQPWTHKKHYPSDVPDSAVIIRKHSTATNLFSCLVFNEAEAFNPRDQLAFAFVRDMMNPKLKLNMFDVEVFEQVTVEYRHNLKGGGGGASGPQTKVANSYWLDSKPSSGKCGRYLSKMWSESNN
nr:uncharacterized protein LOC109188594 [Ipomoea batatas]